MRLTGAQNIYKRICILMIVMSVFWIYIPRIHAGENRIGLSASVLSGPEPLGPVGKYLDNGIYRLSAMGRDVSDNKFQGSFAGIATDASCFTFMARIVTRPDSTTDAQYGISIRAGLDGTQKCVNLRYDGRKPFRCWGWYMRYHVTPSTHDGSRRSYHYGFDRDSTKPQNVWMKIQRRYPYVFTYISDDAKKWHSVGDDYLKALLPQKVWVGFMLTAGGDGKTTNSAEFDNISFTVDTDSADTTTSQLLEEYHPPLEPWKMYLKKVATNSKKEPFISPFLMMPADMKSDQIRAILFSAGSKEVVINGNEAMKWDKGPGRLRKPVEMDQWEDELILPETRAFNQILKHYGIVRIGGYFRAEYYRKAVTELAEMSGIDFLPNVPFMVTGASFAGGLSAKTAALYPELTIACSPVIIGMAGADTDDRNILNTPHLHVFGSKDGVHLKKAYEAIPLLAQKDALWGCAPMWYVYHRQHKSFSLIMPYFLETTKYRLPDKPDYSQPIQLKSLNIKDGWYGLVETWTTNFPKIIPAKTDGIENLNRVWLPSKKIARIWQAFVSENPKTVIHFPANDGHSNWGLPDPHGWHNSFIEANKPFNLIASGPLGKNLNVEYYSGLENLKILDGKDYRVKLAGLKPGLHSIYAITTINDKKEISRPVTIMFQSRK